MPEFKAPCRHFSSISLHGYVCSLIIGGKEQIVTFPFDKCSYNFEGVASGAQLYFYPHCEKCMGVDSFSDAVDRAIKDEVLVISWSQGKKLDKFRESVKSPADDKAGLKLLEAFGKHVLTCTAVGNDGPIGGSALHGMPWCMTVGSSTTEHILVADLEIAILKNDNIPSSSGDVLNEIKEDGKTFIVLKSMQVLLIYDLNYVLLIYVINAN